ncbi:MAG: hypothetical protein SFZ23_11420 [Planctomycetota bacterium]|nr:hypothetical protein [Planctomycetota bacterium]
MAKVRHRVGPSVRSGFASILACGSLLAFSGESLQGRADAAPSRLSTLAVTGDAAPGAAGATFLAFETPVAARGSLVAVNAFLTGNVTPSNATGIFFGSPSTFTLWLRGGDLAPGTPGLRFDALDGNDLPVTGDSGTLAVEAFAGAPGNSRFGIWTLSEPGVAVPIAVTGDAAPAIAGAQFDNFTSPLLSASGDVFFYSNLREGPGGIVFDNKGTLWTGGTASLRLIGRWDAPAPGTGGVFLRFTSTFWSVNDLGQAAVRATLEVGTGGVTTQNDEGIWRSTRQSDPGSLQLVVREGDPAPDIANGVFASFQASPPINNLGEVLVWGRLRQGTGVDASNDDVLYVARPSPGGADVLTLVLREGGDAPGIPGATIRSLGSEHVISDSGRVLALVSLLEGPGGVTIANDSVLLAGTPSPTGDLAPLAREGDAFGGTVGQLVDSFVGLHLNRAGTACYIASYDNAGVRGGALFIARPGQEPELVAQTNQLFEIPDRPGDQRFVQFFRFNTLPSGGSDGRRTALANDDSLAFGLIFGGGTEGVFVLRPAGCPADFNGDGQGDLFDYLDFSAAFGTDDPSADVDANGQVDFLDYLEFVLRFDQGCP